MTPSLPLSGPGKAGAGCGGVAGGSLVGCRTVTPLTERDDRAAIRAAASELRRGMSAAVVAEWLSDYVKASS